MGDETTEKIGGERRESTPEPVIEPPPPTTVATDHPRQYGQPVYPPPPTPLYEQAGYASEEEMMTDIRKSAEPLSFEEVINRFAGAAKQFESAFGTGMASGINQDAQFFPEKGGFTARKLSPFLIFGLWPVLRIVLLAFLIGAVCGFVLNALV